MDDVANIEHDRMRAPERLLTRPKQTPIWCLKANQFLGAAAFACLAKYLPVYYAGIGLELSVIGALGTVGMLVNFIGQLFWSWVIDCVGSYKGILAGTQIAATATLLLFCLPVVQHSVALVATVAITTTFFNSTGGSIIDAMCMRVLDEYKKNALWWDTPRTRYGAAQTYGDQRLYSAVGWGGMSLLMGQIIDMFGLNMMFVGFALIQTVNIGIIIIFVPSPSEEDKKKIAEQKKEGNSKGICSVCSFSVMWFFLNLFLYGVAMNLIENFLFIYLIQEFDPPAPNVLLGGSTTIMCIFEIPVFAYLGHILEKGGNLTMAAVLFFCQVVTAARCYMYISVPSNNVWLSALISPLHGICFAAMWLASMEYAKRLAGPTNLAKMTGLVNGVYYSVSMGVGSLIWGIMTDKQQGVGFVSSFQLDGVALMIWSIIFQLGLWCMTRREPDPEALLSSSNQARDVPTAPA